MPDSLSTPPWNERTIVRPGRVVLASHQDEDDIYSFLVSLWANNSSGWGYFYSPPIVLRQIEVGTRQDPKTRSDPTDERRGIIGIIRDEGKITASVGLFIMPPVWFTTLPGLTELWLHVKPGADARYEQDLFDFCAWAHQTMKRDLSGKWNAPFPLSTGFMHRGKRFEAMERLWRRRSRGHKAGVLFIAD